VKAIRDPSNDVASSSNREWMVNEILSLFGETHHHWDYFFTTASLHILVCKPL